MQKEVYQTFQESLVEAEKERFLLHGGRSR